MQNRRCGQSGRHAWVAYLLPKGSERVNGKSGDSGRALLSSQVTSDLMDTSRSKSSCEDGSSSSGGGGGRR